MDLTNNSTNGDSQFLRLHQMRIDMYYAYVKLLNNQQRSFENFVLEHACLGVHMDVYQKTTHSASPLRSQLRRDLSQTTSEEMATTWFAWTRELSKRKRPIELPDPTILELVGHLVRARLAQQDLQIGTGANVGCSSANISPQSGIRGGPDLYRLYIWSNDHQRRAIEDVVLGHVFFPQGVCAYDASGDWNFFERDWAYEQLESYLGRRAAITWKKWVTELSEKYLAPSACPHEVLNMLKNLVLVKSDDRWLASELEGIREKRLTEVATGSLSSPFDV
jgi:hypothetical protein